VRMLRWLHAMPRSLSVSMGISYTLQHGATTTFAATVMSMAVRCRRRDLVPRYLVGPSYVRPLASTLINSVPLPRCKVRGAFRRPSMASLLHLECSGIRTPLSSCFDFYQYTTHKSTLHLKFSSTFTVIRINHFFKHTSFPGTSLQNLHHALSVTSSNSNFFPINSKAARISDLAVHTAIGSCSSRQRNIIDIRQWHDQTLRLLTMMLGSVRTAKLRSSPRTQSSTAYRAVTIRPATLPAQVNISSLHIFIICMRLIIAQHMSCSTRL
jgi:hypothetical protein